MSKVIIDFVDLGKKKDAQMSVRIPKDFEQLLREVFLWRKENGHSSNWNEFVLQMFACSLLCSNPTEYMPQFLLPNVEDMISKINFQNAITDQKTDSITQNTTLENGNNGQDATA